MLWKVWCAIKEHFWEYINSFELRKYFSNQHNHQSWNWSDWRSWALLKPTTRAQSWQSFGEKLHFMLQQFKWRQMWYFCLRTPSFVLWAHIASCAFRTCTDTEGEEVKEQNTGHGHNIIRNNWHEMNKVSHLPLKWNIFMYIMYDMVELRVLLSWYLQSTIIIIFVRMPYIFMLPNEARAEFWQ